MTGKINGTAIDFAARTNRPAPLDRDAAFWRNELADIKASGMEYVVIARVLEGGRAHYHSERFEEWCERDALAMVMEAALEAHLEVYLGLYMNMGFWDRSRDFPRMLRRDLSICRAVLEELIPRYATHPMLAGIYIPNEPDRDNLDTPERAAALKEFYTDLCPFIKGRCSLPVLVAPFFSKSIPPIELAAWWDAFLDCPMFDILAMQDGVGCLRQIAPGDVERYYRELAPVFAKRGIEFWNDLETFVHQPTDEEHWTFSPAPIERIDEQYRLAASYIASTFTWEFGHFLGRQLVGRDRYEEFCAWNLCGDTSA